MRAILLALLLLSACKSSGAAADAKGAIKLTPVAGGFSQPTDLQFVPGTDGLLLVLEKEGRGAWVELQGGRKGTFVELPVSTRSEMGLLGLAFHPDFAKNRRIYLNYTVRSDGGHESRISEFVLPAGDPIGTAR